MAVTVFIRYQLDPFKRVHVRAVCQALAHHHPAGAVAI